MSKSLKTNYIFNLVNTVTGVLFPLITFPYASRVLMPEGIGQVGFYQSIIDYIVLLSGFGIPLYAVREISRLRGDKQLRDKASLEILSLHVLLSVISYVFVFLIAAFFSKVQVNVPLFLILSSSIFLTAIGCEWFYQGIEDFRYITIRSLIIRCISLLVLFTFVKTKDDILWYGLYTIMATVGGYAFNFIRLRKHIHVKELKWSSLRLFRHVKPTLPIFALNLISSIYVTMNTVILGYFHDSADVGFFTISFKLSHIAVAVISSLGTVMLPRLSNLAANNQMSDFTELIQKGMQFTIALTLPISVAIILLASPLIQSFGGGKYLDAIPSLMLLAPSVLFISVAHVLISQILYPQGKEKIVMRSMLTGAIISIVLNIWLIPRFSYIGASVSMSIAELIVTLGMMYWGRQYIAIRWNKHYWTYIQGTCLLTGGLLAYQHWVQMSYLWQLTTSIVIGTTIYCVFLVWKKEPVSRHVIQFLLRK